LTLDPPREVDQIAVGDGPEGMAVSPTGEYAISLLTNGSGGSVPDKAFFRQDHAIAALLKSDGKTVRKVGQTEVGTLSEGIAFSPDGRYVYVANLGKRSSLPIGSKATSSLPWGRRSNCPAIPHRCAAVRRNA